MTASYLQPHSLCSAICDKVRERILSHDLPPGSDINDGVLAKEFGVSRTPVREALKMLCQEGLLTATPRRGMSVTRLSPAQVAEAQQLCTLLDKHLMQQKQHVCACTQLSEQLLRTAHVRLQLALGPAPLQATVPHHNPHQYTKQ